MSATLVIMAAGLASRYGGAKQIEKVGPGGEILMEYTIHDAQRAGFDRFVIILQPQMLEDFRAVCGERLEGKAHVDYAFQSFDALPDWFAVPHEALWHRPRRTQRKGRDHRQVCRGERRRLLRPRRLHADVRSA